MARGSRTAATWTSQQYERLCTNLRARAKLSPIHRCFFSFYSFSSPLFLLLHLLRLSTLLYLLFHLSFTVSHFAAFRSSSFASEGTPVRAYARALTHTHTHTHARTHTHRHIHAHKTRGVTTSLRSIFYSLCMYTSDGELGLQETATVPQIV